MARALCSLGAFHRAAAVLTFLPFLPPFLGEGGANLILSILSTPTRPGRVGESHRPRDMGAGPLTGLDAHVCYHHTAVSAYSHWRVIHVGKSKRYRLLVLLCIPLQGRRYRS